ncbi:MAG: metal ABC transporter substrate-binding protein [Candidatus Bipolaricaulota bacterium]|nr:metal ABC transporter substrate-binding protein [Candidatus Bipolaricaulota bacterium]
MRVRHVVLLGSTFLAALSLHVVSQITVLCTTTIVGDVVREIAGDDASVAVLMPVGADPHAFQASPRDAIAVEAADLVFLSGAGLEGSLAPLLQAARGRVVDLSSELTLRQNLLPDEGGFDPHVWFDPRNVAAWSETIAQVLAMADPDHASMYRARADVYQKEIGELDLWIRDRVATVPEDARRLVTDHEAFGYFANLYGFEQTGTILPGYSTLSEPSARELAALEDAIRAAGVPCIFVGTTIPSDLSEQVAADTGTRIVFLYTGSLSEPDGPAATYLDLMRFDVEQIVRGLTASP